MKKSFNIAAGFVALSAMMFAVLGSSCSQNEAKDYTQYVNVFIGTGGHGHTYPGAVVPFEPFSPAQTLASTVGMPARAITTTTAPSTAFRTLTSAAPVAATLAMCW